MTHLPFIVAAYGLTLGAFAVLGMGSAVRLRRATRRLRAVDPRGGTRRPC
ncbi:MAG: heme exporter protein CcmD [Gluconacetobacter diazotrophicus]|nr:heme exporter protein CcmD [Gluconacetobacter diazotrophicus]